MQYIVHVYYTLLFNIYYYVREFFTFDGSNTIQYSCYIIVAYIVLYIIIRLFCVPPTGGQMANNTPRVYMVRHDGVMRWRETEPILCVLR